MERWLVGKLKDRKVMQEGKIKGDGKAEGVVWWRRVKKEKKKVKMQKVEERKR